MCIAPNILSNGQSTACRKCWQCLEHRVDNWVGRCIAESKISVASAFITLTYGRDEHGNESHARAAILTYSDVQKYFKQLRNRGLKLRYLVVGEVGSAKGRTHWHIIVFFQKTLPDGFLDYGGNSWCRELRDDPVFVPLVWDKRFNEPCWPHGFSQWETLAKGSAKGSVRYACKYINKDVDDPAAQSKLCMSKRPPIGAPYFEQRAQRYVDEGISPQDAFYQFPDEAKRKSDGKPIRFRLAGKSADLFAQHFIDKWQVQRSGQHWPHSEFIEDYQDRITRDEWDREAHVLEETIRPARRWPFAPPSGYVDKDIHWSNDIHDAGPMVKTEAGPLWYGPNAEGVNGWRSEKPASPWQQQPRYQPKPENRSEWTQSRWVEHLAPRWVYWISISAPIGRYVQAKGLLQDGKAVWLRSMMR